jgi:hypothetical protein
MKLGKLPHVADRRDLKFKAFAKPSKLPKPPRHFGHESLVSQWNMLGNDQVGDCVFAGACHEHMLWCAEAGTQTTFTDQNALAAYSAVTGYTPTDPNTDQGTDVREALKYRRDTGISDATGRPHRIGAFVALQPGNTDHLYAALYLFGAVGIGIEFPASAMDQFNAGKPWSVVRGASIDGGHYIPLVARRGSLVCVTWGKTQPMTLGFYKKYCDEAWAFVSEDDLKDGKTLEGFDLTALNEALTEL